MKECPTCRALNDAAAAACRGCQSPFPGARTVVAPPIGPTKTCPRCGFVAATDAPQCPKCGLRPRSGLPAPWRVGLVFVGALVIGIFIWAWATMRDGVISATRTGSIFTDVYVESYRSTPILGVRVRAVGRHAAGGVQRTEFQVQTFEGEETVTIPPKGRVWFRISAEYGDIEDMWAEDGDGKRLALLRSKGL